MTRRNHLLLPLYLVALTLVLLPLGEIAVSSWPMRPGEVDWRFGAVGLLSRALLMPLLGLVLALVGAVLGRRPAAQRAVLAASGALLLLLATVIVLFALDAVQMRPRIRAEARHSFDVIAAVAMVKLVTGAAIALALARASRAALRQDRRPHAAGKREAAATLLIATGPARAARPAVE